MITVPAQSFCEPTRAKFTAAARSMPGVCGVFLSSRSLLMTRTPSLRQSFSDFNYLPQGVISGPRLCAHALRITESHDIQHCNFAPRVALGSAQMDHPRPAGRGNGAGGGHVRYGP